MANPTEISRGRRHAALALVLLPTAVAFVSVIEKEVPIRQALPFGAALVAAGIGLSRRSMLAQVLARGTLWGVLTLALLVVLGGNAQFGNWSGPLIVAVVALVFVVPIAVALALARPGLHDALTESSHWLVAGATGSAATGVAALFLGLPTLAWTQSWFLVWVVAAGGVALASAVFAVRGHVLGTVLVAVGAVGGLVAWFFVKDDAMSTFMVIPALPGIDAWLSPPLRLVVPALPCLAGLWLVGAIGIQKATAPREH